MEESPEFAVTVKYCESEEANMVSTSLVSTSVRSKFKLKILSSSSILSLIRVIIGLSLTGDTTKVNIVESIKSPSETTTVMFEVPFQSRIGSAVIVTFSEFADTRTEFVSEKTLNISVSPVSISVTSNKNVSVASSKII